MHGKYRAIYRGEVMPFLQPGPTTFATRFNIINMYDQEDSIRRGRNKRSHCYSELSSSQMGGLQGGFLETLSISDSIIKWRLTAEQFFIKGTYSCRDLERNFRFLD